MASIEQTKDALEAQREQAAQMTDRALSAINDVVALSSHTITAIGVMATIIALIGGFAIYLAARDVANRVATRRIDAYIRTEEGRALILQTIRDEVQAQLQAKIVVAVQPDPTSSKPFSFPKPPTGAGGAP